VSRAAKGGAARYGAKVGATQGRAAPGRGEKGKGARFDDGERAKPARRKPAPDTGPGTRQLRVAEEIRHVLAGVFGRHDFRDPDLADAQVTVTEVRIGPDLRHAMVYYTRLGRTDADALLPALRRAAVYLRGQIAHALRLRHAPDLHFLIDETLDYAMHINQVMRAPEVARDLGPKAAPEADADLTPEADADLAPEADADLPIKANAEPGVKPDADPA